MSFVWLFCLFTDCSVDMGQRSPANSVGISCRAGCGDGEGEGGDGRRRWLMLRSFFFDRSSKYKDSPTS